MMVKNIFTPQWESIKTHKVPSWYEDCKLGIFIHWGLYSIPAFANPLAEFGSINDKEWFSDNPYAEWYLNSIRMKTGATYEYHGLQYGYNFRYEDFTELWKTEKYDPEEWADLFKKAGAGYVVMVTKHHDGFCLFPSAYTDYNAENRGPKKDLVGLMTDAVRKKGMKMGLYYSGLLDWRFADDPIYTMQQLKLNYCPTYEYADYAYKQALELIERYRPSLFWNDIGWPEAGERQLPFLFSHYYNMCPEGVVNDRFNGLWSDFLTKEYQYGDINREQKWEMCRGLGLSFGYNAREGEEHTLGVEQLVSLLVSTVANNGNLLINIGPRGDGSIPEIQASKLRGLGKWLSVNGEAIYGSQCSNRCSVITDEADIHFTIKNNDLFVIIDKLKQGDSKIILQNITGIPKPLDRETQYYFKQRGNDMEVGILSHSSGRAAVVLKFQHDETIDMTK